MASLSWCALQTVEIERLKKHNAELEAQCSHLSTSKKVLHAKCQGLKKGKDTIIAELLAEVLQNTWATLADLEARLKVVEAIRDLFSLIALEVFSRCRR
uniref:Uncharacterized protein n=1 Tax=Oryza brachyantha TaxID=4533 RepID=J3N0V7_ORYBR